MFGIGDWIRGHVMDALYEHHTNSVPQRTTATSLALHGNSFISVHPISNGYLLQMNSLSIGGPPTIVYCEDQQAISEQLITLIARERLGIPPNVNIGAQANLSGAQAGYPPPLQSKF